MIPMADFIRKISFLDPKTSVEKKLTFTVPEDLLSALTPDDNLDSVIGLIQSSHFLGNKFLDQSLKKTVYDLDMHVFNLNGKKIPMKYSWNCVDVDRDYAMYYKNYLLSGCEFGYNTHRPIISADMNAYWFYSDF
jgi:hypothetical protein